jgi:hydroxymethylpyrimidine pyrophosphatase-like HAD family hydrolase
LQELHPRTEKAIKALQKKHPRVPVIICSGKQYQSCLALRRQLGLKDEVASAHCNGGILQRGPNGIEILKAEGLPAQAAVAIAEMMRSRACFLFFTDSIAFVSTDASEGSRDWLAFSSKCKPRLVVSLGS